MELHLGQDGWGHDVRLDPTRQDPQWLDVVGPNMDGGPTIIMVHLQYAFLCDLTNLDDRQDNCLPMLSTWQKIWIAAAVPMKMTWLPLHPPRHPLRRRERDKAMQKASPKVLALKTSKLL